MTRLVLSGFYGMGNSGDEAVLAALAQLLREREPEVEITVLSGDPAATAQTHRVQAVPRMEPRAGWHALRRSDLLISGGGSLLQDVTSVQSLLYYLAVMMLARLAGRPVVVLAQGIGPIRRPALRRLTARILAGARRITVRDAESAAELARLGVGRKGNPPIEVTADPVFALGLGEGTNPSPQPPPRSGEGEQALGLLDRGSHSALLGVSVRPWPGVESMLPAMAAALRAAMAAGARPVLLPLQPDQDTPICCRLAEALGGAPVLTPAPSPTEWPAVIRQFDLVLAMRLHALIFAAAAGVPLLGISYDPKIDHLLARLQLRPAGCVEDLNSDTLTARLTAALDDPDRERAPEATVAALREAARRNADVALEAAASRKPS